MTSDRKRAEAPLDGEKRLLEMVASGSPLEDVLETMCRLVERCGRNQQDAGDEAMANGHAWLRAEKARADELRDHNTG